MSVVMQPIATFTVSSSTVTSPNFTNIPQNFTDLYLTITSRDTTTSTLNTAGIGMTVNNDLSSSRAYSGGTFKTYGTNITTDYSVNNQYQLGGWIPNSGYSANVFGSTSFYFPNYSSQLYKMWFCESIAENLTATGNSYYQSSNMYRSAMPITSIMPYNSGGPYYYAIGTTMTLYGIIAPGNGRTIKGVGTGTYQIVYGNDGYIYHYYYTPGGTFIPNQNLNCDILVVAGGGSGGTGYGAGGGGGGVQYFANQSLTQGTTYTVSVGTGAIAQTLPNSPGYYGNNSQFGSLTAAIGGGRGGSDVNAGGNGGSGGGGGGGSTGAINVGGIGSQGYNGGTGTGALGAGGGGAGGVGGGNLGANVGGAGGAGAYYFNTFWAGGGAGNGTGGTGPAAAPGGGVPVNVNPQPNTGQGSAGDTGGPGGNGIVIVRYQG